MAKSRVDETKGQGVVIFRKAHFRDRLNKSLIGAPFVGELSPDETSRELTRLVCPFEFRDDARKPLVPFEPFCERGEILGRREAFDNFERNIVPFS